MGNLTESMHYSRSERVAIIVIVAIIVAIVVLLFTPIMRPGPDLSNLPDIDSLRTLHDNAVREHDEKIAFDAAFAESSAAAIKLHPFRFNPNGLSTDKWKELGLTDKQIRSIKNYEMKGGKFYSKEDFKRMYLITAEEYAILEPYIDIPKEKYKRVENKPVEKKKQSVRETKPEVIVNINTADSAQLTLLPGVGEWSAHRIIDYRNRLGGFATTDQLTEVKGIDSTRYAKIKHLVVVDNEKLTPVRINDAEFADLLRHPYLTYKMVKAIVNYRDKRGLIKDYDQLRQIIAEEPNSLLIKYVSFE